MLKFKDDDKERDLDFLSHLLGEIRDYARSAGQNPDETLKSIAEWFLAILEIATLNGSLEGGNTNDRQH